MKNRSSTNYVLQRYLVNLLKHDLLRSKRKRHNYRSIMISHFIIIALNPR
ncbi:hypothetical protein V1478_013167 [Vespula squamosa]|uniref:Uncharacterized protein n=1 Tax=Vespula squamosa TaxID=30214 RepID=A0ABD2AA20_VESSQ